MFEIHDEPHGRLVSLTVHRCEPFRFAQEGAEGVNPRLPLGVDCCDAPRRTEALAPLDQAAAAGRRRNHPVLVGEFGADSKAPLDARGLPWMAWELAPGFGIHDPVAGRCHVRGRRAADRRPRQPRPQAAASG